MEYVNANTYTYTFSYSTSLNDTDGSETLTLKLNNVPDGENLTLTSGNGYTMTSNNNGTYTITGFSAGSTSVNDTVTLEITRLNEPDFSSIQIEATATESSNSDTATTTASVNNTAPTISGDLGATVNEGGSVVLTTTDLNFSDSDITDTASNVTFTASSFTNGSISVNEQAKTFTGTQLASRASLVRADRSSATSGTFNVNVEDGNEDLSSPTNSTFQITVNSTNTIPSGTVLFDGDSDTYTQVFDGDNSDGSGSGDDNSWTSSSISSGITNERLEIANGTNVSKIFNFGADNDGKKVDISFYTSNDGEWDGNSDKFKIVTNEGDVTETEAEYRGDQNNGVTVTLQNAVIDSTGQLTITIYNNANPPEDPQASTEVLYMDNLIITAVDDLVDTTEVPIAIDLDGNGITYLSRNENVILLNQSTGESLNIAWVAGSDGLLVIDANNSGTIDENGEFVFSEWSEDAKTDAEAIAEVFDTNKDMVLDAQDEQFEQFAIWQDANTDGISDANELKSLAEHSIKSIDLSYQEGSESRITADGDVQVFGQLTVNYEDGTTGLAEDTAFKTSVIQAGEAERSESEFNNADGECILKRIHHWAGGSD